MKDLYYFTQRIEKQLIKEELGECWLWTGATNTEGYGVFCDRKEQKRNRMAHKDFYELSTKTKIINYACHHCDTPLCINPAHIYDGTPQQNRQDAVKRKRIAPKKLTDSKIQEIVKLFHEGVEQKEIAIRIGVCAMTIMRFLNGKLNQYTHNYVEEAKQKRDASIKDLFLQGKSLSEIMIQADVPASVVWDIVPEIREKDKGKESKTNLQIKATLGIEERNKAIKEQRESGKSVKEIAQEFGVSVQLVYNIIRRI